MLGWKVLWGETGEIGFTEGDGRGVSEDEEQGESLLDLHVWCKEIGEAGFVEGVLSEERRDEHGVDLGVGSVLVSFCVVVECKRSAKEGEGKGATAGLQMFFCRGEDFVVTAS